MSGVELVAAFVTQQRCALQSMESLCVGYQLAILHCAG